MNSDRCKNFECVVALHKSFIYPEKRVKRFPEKKKSLNGSQKLGQEFNNAVTLQFSSSHLPLAIKPDCSK